MSASQRFGQYMEHLAEDSGIGIGVRAEGLLPGLMLPLARKSVERTDGGTGRSAARQRAASVAASLRRPRPSGRTKNCCDGSVTGSCPRWIGLVAASGSLTTRAFPKKGTHWGGRATVLRRTGQAGQLPSRGQCLVGNGAGQRAGGVPTVSAQGVGRRSGTAQGKQASPTR